MKYFYLLLLFLIGFTITSAQTDSISSQIETVVISDKRIQLEYSEESRNIIIIDKNQIENSPAMSVAELLQNVAVLT